MKTKPITFTQLAEAYLAERIVTRIYASNVRRVAARAGAVSVESVNAYLKARAASRKSTTVRSERTLLLTLYRWGYENGKIADAPRGVMKIKARKAPTKAWTVPQLRQMVEATHARDGETLKSGASLGAFLRCWVLVAYESGARFGDVMSFVASNVDGDTLSWTQSKTGDPMVRLLTKACQDAVHEMLKASPDGKILGWACGHRMAMQHMRTFIDSLGFGGTGKWLRRSGATHCEMEKAGAGRMHLGHRSPALFEQAYADWAQLRTRTPKTPEIA